MELSDVKVDTQQSLILPWEETILMPIGDVQLGADGADLDRFKRHMEWGLKNNAYFIGLGDYVDVASPSGRQKIKNADFYDSVKDALEEQAMVHIEQFMECVKGSEGRWLGLVHGHHYYEFEDGQTSDTIIAERLKTRFLGTCTIVRLQFPRKGNRGPSLEIWAHHGQGSGVTMASPLNKLERMMSRFPTVDVFLIGHYSRMVGYPIEVMIPTWGKKPTLKSKKRILASTGGFAKGYNVGSKRGNKPRGSYVEEAMMPPTNLGAPIFLLNPVHTSTEDRVDPHILQ